MEQAHVVILVFRVKADNRRASEVLGDQVKALEDLPDAEIVEHGIHTDVDYAAVHALTRSGRKPSAYEPQHIDNILDFTYVQQRSNYLSCATQRVFISELLKTVLLSKRFGNLDPESGLAAVAQLAEEKDGEKITRLIERMPVGVDGLQHERLKEELEQVLSAYRSTLPRRQR